MGKKKKVKASPPVKSAASVTRSLTTSSVDIYKAHALRVSAPSFWWENIREMSESVAELERAFHFP